MEGHFTTGDWGLRAVALPRGRDTWPLQRLAVSPNEILGMKEIMHKHIIDAYVDMNRSTNCHLYSLKHTTKIAQNVLETAILGVESISCACIC